jgi:hypothetical protein
MYCAANSQQALAGLARVDACTLSTVATDQVAHRAQCGKG